MTIYTTTLTGGSITISSGDGVSSISVQADATSGSFSVLGSGTFQGNDSDTVVMTAGEVYDAASPSPQSPIDGLIITWISGNVKINMAQL